MLPKDAEAAGKIFDGKPANVSKLPEHRGGHNQGGEIGENYQKYVGDKLKNLNKHQKLGRKRPSFATR